MPTKKTYILKKIQNSLHTIYMKTSADIVEHNNTTVKTELDNINTFINSMSHNSLFRGKNLGVVTAENIDDFITSHGISTGTFNDLYVGDYFTAAYNGTNVVFRIAGLDVFWNNGDNTNSSGILGILNVHHVCVVPDNNLFTHGMNTTNTTGASENENNTSGLKAYAGSDMFQIVMPEVNTELEKVFGSHLLGHRDLLSNNMDPNAVSANFTTSKGAANGWGWYDCKANLMSESEVYGSIVWSSNGYNTGAAQRQLPLFKLEPKYINFSRSWFWLRDVVNNAHFCGYSDYGNATCYSASSTLGVRPRFLIG